jgi:NAD(P)-dependent dehydrogenase (short-subunit alcohol dehydrogenase family)
MTTAIVTGACGGLGSLVVDQLAADTRVQVLALDAISAAQAAPSNVHHAQCDLTDRKAVREVMHHFNGEGDKISAIVNCIGISPKDQGTKVPIRDIGEDDWRRVLDVNVLAPLIVIQESWDRLEDGVASIVNTGSLMAKTGSGGALGTRHGPPSPAGAHYSASKAAFMNLTLSLARELAPRRIRCNGVNPGQIAGGMRGTVGADDMQEMLREIPLARGGTYAEVAAVIDFLLSDRSSYITGEVIDVNGGWYCD